jgi:hypothetical protein
MTVYVDDAGIPASVTNNDNGKVHTSRWCHLFTDKDDQTELHELAARIGLKRHWFQDHNESAPWMWHYDVTSGKRWQAVRAGAEEISWRDAGLLVRRRAQAAREGS